MDAGGRIDLKIGDLALSVQGAQDPVRTVKQVLRFVQRLVEETPEMTGAGVVLDDAAVSGLLADLEAGGGLPEGSFTVTPGLILTAGAPAGAGQDGQDHPASAAPAATGAALSAPETVFDDPDSDAPLARGGAWDDPAQAEPDSPDFDAAAAAADRIAPAPRDDEEGPGTDPAMPAGATVAAIAGLGQIGAAGRRPSATHDPEPEPARVEDERDPMEPAFARLRTAMAMEAGSRTAPGPEPAQPGTAPDTAPGASAPAPHDGEAASDAAPPAGAPETEDIPNIFQRVSGDHSRPAAGEMRSEINIFSRGDPGPAAPVREEDERVSISAGPETGGARPLPDTAPGWIEDPDEPAPDPEEAAAPGAPSEAPATSRFDALVARYRSQPPGTQEPDLPEPASHAAEPARATEAPARAAPGALDTPPDAAILARLSGAEDVADLLAAAAASLALGGRSHFSRREVMEAFDAIPGDHARSLEARIKGYGKLVRSGALVLVEDGLFSLSEAEEDRFRAMLG